MTRIVGIHGIGNHHYLNNTGSASAAANQISADWAYALNTGLAEIGSALIDQTDLRVAYYAHLLHRGTAQGTTDFGHLDDDAQDLLIAWVQELTPAIVPQISQGPRTARARAAADWLTRHFGDPVRYAAVIFCREVSTYLSQPTRRQAVRNAVAETIARHRARLIIAHSLGSVVAYEALWQYSQPNIGLLLTLGSPLAIPHVIFDRLDPKPVNRRGARPPSVESWINLADVGDIVAVPRTGLKPYFDGLDYDNPAIVIDRRAFHAVRSYLACRDTAMIVAPHLP